MKTKNRDNDVSNVNLDAAGGLALGWRMQELYLAKLSPQAGIAQADRSNAPSLISWTQLSPNQKALVLLNEVHTHLGSLGLEQRTAADFKAVATSFDSASEKDRGTFNNNLQTLHVHLITLTTASDPKIGKAYRLGFAMAETMFLPYRLGPAQLKEVMNQYRLANIFGWLIDLKSALPDHSSEAVQSSLLKWEEWYRVIGEAGATDPSLVQPINTALRQQAETWRAILTGEKKAIDLLAASDYLQAAGDMVTHVATLIATVVKTRTGMLIGGSLLVLVLLFALVGLVAGNAAITATIAALGAVGITAGGIGAAVEKALQPVQSALWQADLSGAIGVAATKLPVSPATTAAAPA